MTKNNLKTEYKIKKDAKDMAILNDYNKMIEAPGAMATAVDDALMKKYNLHSRSSIWTARKRAEKQIKENELSTTKTV
jgi:hypothetical protein